MSLNLPAEPPFLENADDETSVALKSTFAIASVGIATLKMLENLLPAAAEEVERESKTLVHNFSTLMEHVHSNGAPTEPVNSAINGIIMGIQFQDRNTQVMDNVACILQRYRGMLEEVCVNIAATREGAVSPAHNIAKAVEGILSSIRLSDIRTRYVQALAKAKMHSHADEAVLADAGNTTDTIELF